MKRKPKRPALRLTPRRRLALTRRLVRLTRRDPWCPEHLKD